MASRLIGRGKTAVRWNGDFVGNRMEEIAKQVMWERMRIAKIDAVNRLYLGHGVETGTMKSRVHIAPGGYNWAKDHIEPRRGAPPLYDDSDPVKLRGKWTLELGSGQKYALYYHQKFDQFLRIPFDAAMKGFKKEVMQTWRLTFR